MYLFQWEKRQKQKEVIFQQKKGRRKTVKFIIEILRY